MLSGLKKRKVLLVVNRSAGVINFRETLIKKFLDNNCIVSIIAGDSHFESQISNLGVDFYCIPFVSRSINLLKNRIYQSKLRKKISSLTPDVVFTFQLIPNLYGPKSAKGICEKIYSMVEGLGDPFSGKGIFGSIIRKYITNSYKESFKNVTKVFFLNKDDSNDFENMKIISPNKIINLNGIGVDLDKFQFSEISNFRSFVMVSRLIKNKGVFEFCEAATICKKINPDIQFILIGQESQIKKKDLSIYIDNKIINYVGECNNVSEFLDNCYCFVLPSYYREGLPMSIMEAMAIGRPIITTNSVGCKETVKNGVNGYLIPIKDSRELANKILLLFGKPKIGLEMGKESRIKAEKEFDSNKISEEIIREILDT